MALVLVLTWVAACGGDGGDDAASLPDELLACDDEGNCVLYTGSSWTEQDVADNCDLEPSAACHDGATVGTCTIDGGTDFETVSTFYQGFWNATSAAQACGGSGGTWEES